MQKKTKTVLKWFLLLARLVYLFIFRDLEVDLPGFIFDENFASCFSRFCFVAYLTMVVNIRSDVGTTWLKIAYQSADSLMLGGLNIFHFVNKCK